MKLTIDTQIQRNNEMLTSSIDGETVMMSIKRGEYYGLGNTGSFIWENIEKLISIKDLVALIISEFNVEEKKCFEDILPFLKELLEKELIIATK